MGSAFAPTGTYDVSHVYRIERFEPDINNWYSDGSLVFLNREEAQEIADMAEKEYPGTEYRVSAVILVVKEEEGS